MRRRLWEWGPLLGALLLAAPAGLQAAPQAASGSGQAPPDAGLAWPAAPVAAIELRVERPAPGSAERSSRSADDTAEPLARDADSTAERSLRSAEYDGQRMPGGRDSSDGPIFQRFASGRDASKTWQTMFEVPVALQPQTEPGAHVVANEGLNWVTAYQPLNRVYFGRSIGYARMVWHPGGRLDTTEVVQWDWSEIVNFAVQPWWVISVGVGVGFMDGLIFYKSGAFKHRLEVFVPVQFGMGLRLGKSWFADAKVLQSSYFGPGPVASAARAVIGLGRNY